MRWLRSLARRLANRLRWGRIAVLQLRPGDVVLVYIKGALSQNQKFLIMESFRTAIERAGHRHVEVMVLDDTISVNVLRKGMGL